MEKAVRGQSAQLEQAKAEIKQLRSERAAAVAQKENMQQERDAVNTLHEQQLEKLQQQRDAAATKHTLELAARLQAKAAAAQRAQEPAQMRSERNAALAQVDAAAA